MSTIIRADAYFLDFWNYTCILNHTEISVLFKPVLGGVTGVAHFIIDHEQTQLKTESSLFVSLVYSLLPNPSGPMK